MRTEYDEANERYTERYTHTDMEMVDGNLVPVLYEPISICTNKEMDAIFPLGDWDKVLEAMHDLHGTPGPIIRRR